MEIGEVVEVRKYQYKGDIDIYIYIFPWEKNGIFLLAFTVEGSG